jgi:hypothetical protein
MPCLGAQFHLLAGILIRGRRKHRGALNATVGDPISCIILYVGVESAAGVFQDSHDGGAEADILGHTLQYTPM